MDGGSGELNAFHRGPATPSPTEIANKGSASSVQCEAEVVIGKEVQTQNGHVLDEGFG
jgi:hypothetical protein